MSLTTIPAALVDATLLTAVWVNPYDLPALQARLLEDAARLGLTQRAWLGSHGDLSDGNLWRSANRGYSVELYWTDQDGRVMVTNRQLPIGYGQ